MPIERTLDLEPSSLQIVLDVLSKHVPNRPVFAFGSRTRGRARRRSDLDLAIGGNAAISIEILADLKESLTESDLPILVDVLDINTVDKGFLVRIQSDFVPVWNTENHQ